MNYETTLLCCHLILFATEKNNSIRIRNQWYGSGTPLHGNTVAKWIAYACLRLGALCRRVLPAVQYSAVCYLSASTLQSRAVSGRAVSGRAVSWPTVSGRAVSRPAISRPAVYRPALYQPPVSRPAVSFAMLPASIHLWPSFYFSQLFTCLHWGSEPSSVHAKWSPTPLSEC